MANEFKVKKGLIVNGSGSTILDIQGSQGQLFSVTDQLSGSLFSVNDISGIPVFEAFSDDTVKIGTFNNEAIIVEGSQTTIQDLNATGSFTGSFTGSYTGSFIGDGSGLTGVPMIPGGTNGQVQYNANGSLDGASGLFYDDVNGRVGIGTNTPSTKLEVNGDILFKSTSDNEGAIKFEVNETNFQIPVAFENIATSPMFLGITAQSGTSAGFVLRHGASSGDGFNIGIDSNDPANLTFVSRDNSNIERMRLTNNGFLGIGTTTPSEALSIQGKISINDGGNSVFIGEDAGSNDDGSDNRNVGIGYQALQNNTTGYRNTANGYQALLNNTTGFNNTANGYATLLNNTTGNSNTANGIAALLNNTTGYQNTANGYEALRNNTTGNRNTATGYQALLNNTGSNNTANGYEALQNNTTGDNNTATGYQALLNNTTGTNNTANGYQALLNNTTGDRNTANGYLALRDNTTGNNNTANGYEALQNNTTGINNTAHGFRVLYNNTTGDRNTAHGYEAGRYISNGGANETGNNSVFIGYDTRPLNDGETNQIVIGYEAIGLGSNTVVLGNDSITTTALKGDVGIGTTDPSEKLHIEDTGLSFEQFPLRLTNPKTDNGVSVGFRLTTGTSTNVRSEIVSTVDTVRNSTDLEFRTGDNTTTPPTVKMGIYEPGNVGINKTDPAHRLDVDGNIRALESFITSNTAGMRSLNSTTLEVGDIDNSNKSTLITAFGSGSDANSQIQLDDGEITIGGGASNRITTITDIPSGGKTKIGDIDGIVNSSTLSIDGATTTNPQFTFNTTGNQVVELSNTTSGGSELLFNPIASGYSTINVAKNTTPLTFAIAGNPVMTIATSNDVGIGTTSPTGKLEVEDSSAGNYLQGLRVTNASDTTNTSTGIRFQTAASSTTVSYSEIRSIRTNSPTGGGTELTFSTTPSDQATTASERIRIKGTGFVGINETSPSERLHVDGNILATGNITANSDKRLKEDIQHIKNPLDIIKQLNGYTYTRNDLDDKTRRHTGVIAQEVLKVLPEAVHGSEEDKYSVAYGNMVGVLIEAIKEQQSQIEELKKLIK